MDTIKSVLTDASNIVCTQNSDDTTSLEFITPQIKTREINADDEAFDNDDSFDVDDSVKTVVAKPQIDKTHDPVLP